MANRHNSRFTGRRILLVVIMSCAVSLVSVAASAATPDWGADSWRWAQRSDKAPAATEPPGASHRIMPLYEIAMVSRLCASPDLRANAGGSPEDCARAVYPFAKPCTSEYHDKFPRGDDAEVGGRLSHRNFAAAYLRCLRVHYLAGSAAENQQ